MMVRLMALMTLCLLQLTAAAQDAENTEPTLKEIGQMTVQAYMFGYPLVLMDKTRRATVGDNVNRLNHLRQFPDHTFTRVVRPNVDTLYSTIWFDLSPEPQVISLPSSGGRYYVMPLYDAWTNVFASIGSRTTGNEAHTVLVAGPDWQGEVPDGMDLRRSPTNLAWAIGRVMSFGGDDIAVANGFQDGIAVQSLSSYLSGSPAPAALSATSSQRFSNPKQAVADMGSGSFFAAVARLMADNPPASEDAAMVDGPLKTLGVVAGETYPPQSRSFRTKAVMDRGVHAAKKLMDSIADRIRKNEGFWAGMPDGVQLGRYGTRYPLRAYVAMAGLGAVEPVDAIYPNTTQDATGAKLVAEKNYVLHMAPHQIPSVNAFWSLTAYNQDFYLPENPINRFAIGSRDPLVFNDDGSLDIYIQQEAPKGVPQANWLPSPAEGTIALNMRLYWPKDRALKGDWDLPGVQVRN